MAEHKAPLSKHVAALVLLAFCSLIEVCSASRLNVPKILLPYYHGERPINFTLEAQDGCYSWRSARPDIASIQAIPDGSGKACSNRAMVTALSTHPSRLNTIVFAEEQGTGHILRCDVIVDVIFSIDIVTTTRVLYLDNSPEQFEVRALDDEGNTFSSLEGLQFEWTLISDTEGGRVIDANTILRILPFEPTPYTPPPYIADMERRGQQGDIILVEGVKTGSAKVSAKLKAFGFREVKASIVRLIVIDNLMLNPSHDIYLLVHAHIKYRVEKLRQGKLAFVTMPSLQYSLELKDSDVASLDRATSIVTGITQGDTEIVLKDKNVKEELSQPTAGIHVVEPSYLGFVVLPGRNWVLETYRIYEINIEIYDKDSHRIHPSENIFVDVKFPQEYFAVQFSSKNGSYHIVQTLQQGVTEIDAALISVSLPDGTVHKLIEPVADKQEVEIFDKILVTPEIVAFPWQPNQKSAYQYTLVATGGSGNYSWSSSVKEVVSVNVHGTVITAGSIGESVVTASDIRNVAHYGTAKVHVLPPADIQFLPARVETVIGTTLDLPLSVTAEIKASGERVMMTDCRHAGFAVSVGDPSVFQLLNEEIELPDGSCAVVRVKALLPGNTLVTVTYNEGNVKLQASVVVATYLPLKSLDPEELAVVAVGSSKTVVLSGGPQPWVLDASFYFQSIEAEDEKWLNLKQITGSGATKSYHLFHAVCLDFGEQVLKVTVGNHPSSKNPFPAITNTSLRIACARPTSLHLIPIIRYPDLNSPCPITPDSHNQIPVRYSQNLEIQVMVADRNGHNFDNFTSLTIKWETSDRNLASFISHMTMLIDIEGEHPGSRKLKAYQTALLSSHASNIGLVSITATIVGYDTKMLKSLDISPVPKISPTISKSLELLLVQDARVTPNKVSIFNHPSSMVSLAVSGGSGHFWVQPSDGSIAKVTYNDKKKQIEVIPQLDGDMVITAYDLCLDSTVQAEAHVYISGVDVIDVRVVDKVQIGKDITASVTVLDTNNKPLRSSYFELMGLKPHPASSIITVRRNLTHPMDEYTAYYVIHGAALGRTSLTFVASLKSGAVISSREKQIQVFPPLKLDPRNVTLIIGAVFQVRSYGGPPPQSHIVYRIVDPDIATINGSGLIRALALGHTVVKGSAEAYHSETGASIVYSEDTIDVYVVRLTDVNIYAPLSMLETGAEMPVYAMGENEHQTPFTFGHAVPGLKFYWSVSNTDVIKLSTVYHKIGLYSDDENNFGMRVHAINPGQATLQLKVVITEPGHNQILNDMVLIEEVQIEVFAKLALINPDACPSVLLVSPNTHTQIKTNRDGAARMMYSILDSPNGSPVVSVGSLGQVTSWSLTGQTSVLVTSYEEFRVNQTLVVLVKVKPVSYLTINCDTVITSSKKLYTFPVGIGLSFIISFHDDVGEKFHATNTELNFRMNRFDLLQVNQGLENGTFVARATSIGNTIFKVWDKNNPRIADYVNVPVDQVIAPTFSDITLGDIICFDSPLMKSDGRRGNWRSQDSNVLFVDSNSGIAIATRPGVTTVYQSLSENFVTHAEVSVHPVRHAYIASNSITYVSTLPRSSPYVFPVILGSHTNVRGDNCSEEFASVYSRLHLHSVPFRCNMKFKDAALSIKAQDLFHVTSGFDIDSSEYYCSISQIESSYSSQLLSTIETSLEISVTVFHQELQPEIQSPIQRVPLLPAFHISQSDISLSNVHPTSDLIIQGVAKVLDTIRVMSNDTSVVELGSIERGTGIHRYPVHLVDSTALLQEDCPVVHIEITSPVTGQSQKLAVKIVYIGQREKPVPIHLSGWARVLQIIANNYQNWLYHILLILATIGALFIGYHFLVAPRYYSAHNTSNVFLQPGQSPTTPPPPYLSPHGYSPSRNPYQSFSSTSPNRRKSPKLWSTGLDSPDRSAGSSGFQPMY
ncbi:nuclear pore membrane glycoprotein 210-like isoform X2 [Ptychodera flava]|uniref:nuclear pore membrane glycoprotein 210-like isoform X2 n=1 Tax=Ptychodera flava TaxID=63121 RepID=UPI00396A02CF